MWLGLWRVVGVGGRKRGWSGVEGKVGRRRRNVLKKCDGHVCYEVLYRAWVIQGVKSECL
jgi:hypothetical protein